MHVEGRSQTQRNQIVRLARAGHLVNPTTDKLVPHRAVRFVAEVVLDGEEKRGCAGFHGQEASSAKWCGKHGLKPMLRADWRPDRAVTIATTDGGLRCGEGE